MIYNYQLNYVYQLTMYNLTITDYDIKTFPRELPRKIHHLGFVSFGKMPKGHGVALIGCTTWRFSRAQFIK